jgi:hypothetical protein
MPRLKIATNLQEIRARYRIRGKRGGPSVIRIVEGIIAFLQSLLEGHNLLLIQYSMKFRTTTELKIIQFSDPVFIATIPRIYQRNQMIAVIKQLTEKLAALPFIKHVKSQRFLSATVTQNKTSQPRGRYQGIYTEAE